MANKQYRLSLQGNMTEDPLVSTSAGNTQLHSFGRRSVWVCDAEVDLPTAGEGAENGDFAVAISQQTLWARSGGAWVQAGGGGGGAPTNVDYLVGTADATLSNEIVVGATPGGELGGTWADPTVDATHAGGTHITDHGALGGLADDDHPQYALDADLTTHAGAADPHTGYVREADANWVDLTDAGETALHTHAGGGSTVNVEEDNVLAGAAGSIDFGTGFDVTFAAAEAEIALDLSEVTTFTDHSARHEDGGADEISITGLSGIPAELTTHAGAVDPHTGYRLESADHTHQSTGAQAGQLDHGLALTGLTDDDHTQYILEALVDAKGDIIAASAADTPARLAVGADDTILMADAAAGTGLKWVASATPGNSALGTTTGSTGTADTFTRGDHTHGITAYTFTIGACIISPAVGVYHVWRAPFACTVTALRGYADVGTTSVINAQRNAVDISTADLTLTPAATWVSDTTLDSTAIASGESVSLEVVTVGTATEITIQLDITRP